MLPSSPMMAPLSALIWLAAAASVAADSCDTEQRFDCHPQDGASKERCLARGCCWRLAELNEHAGGIGVPACFYPSNHRPYVMVNMTETVDGFTAYYKLRKDPVYAGEFKMARLRVLYVSEAALMAEWCDAAREPWRPPLPLLPTVHGGKARMYRVGTTRTGGLRVVRLVDNATLLDTDLPGLVLSDRFLQLSTRLPSADIYGLGERRGRLRVDTNWSRHAFYNRDAVPENGNNLYGSHPFYLALETSGRAHGSLLWNSHPAEVTVQPTALTWRATGGALSLLVLAGPTPADVVAQYTEAVGRPAMPPYWALGFHLCRFGYGSAEATREVWQRTRNVGIPFDVQWNDIDYMDRQNDFTIDKDKYGSLPSLVKDIHSAGMHYVPLVDPGVSGAEPPGSYPAYDVAVDMRVLILNASRLPFVGKVWNGVNTVWPDFTHPNATSYWSKMFRILHDVVPFDGAWIDMNEISNFVDGQLGVGCAREDRPWIPHHLGGRLESKTLCPDALHYAGTHEQVHNLHALTEAKVTYEVLADLRRGSRPFIISRASSPGFGRYAGHWTGDVRSTWDDMRASIPGMLQFSLFGVPLVGADICGFGGNTTPELCKRWMQLGALYPFSRNHADKNAAPQDPVSLGPEVVEASKSALRVRYALLPYLYTLFWRAHTSGQTVVRPLWMEFPRDKLARDVDQSFMWGSAILAAPVLEPGANSTPVYVPAGRWYTLNGTKPIRFSGMGRLDEYHTLLLRGGRAVFTQPPAPKGQVTTTNTRLRQFELLVPPCEMGRAHGELYWDDGDKIVTEYSWVEVRAEMNSTVGWLRGAARHFSFPTPPLARVFVLGQSEPSSVTLQGRPVQFKYNADKQLLTISPPPLRLDQPFELLWHYRH